MIFVELLIAIVVALILSLLLAGLATTWRGSATRPSFATALFSFMILFLATWAGGLWLTPFGPVIAT